MIVRETAAKSNPVIAETMPMLGAALMGLVLFVACANVADPMFSRSLAPQREMAV